jgi:hypothetical protein
MKNKNNTEDYYVFFQEIPQADYYTDIEIQDEYENPTDAPPTGLSDEQVSQLALDSLSEARRRRPHRQPPADDISPPEN